MLLDVLSSESKVTKNGQVSLPAELRRRWDAKSVLFLDKGDHAVIFPMPDDPIEALYGKYAGGPGPTGDEWRAEEREAEAEREEAREAARKLANKQREGDR